MYSATEQSESCLYFFCTPADLFILVRMALELWKSGKHRTESTLCPENRACPVSTRMQAPLLTAANQYLPQLLYQSWYISVN